MPSVSLLNLSNVVWGDFLTSHCSSLMNFFSNSCVILYKIQRLSFCLSIFSSAMALVRRQGVSPRLLLVVMVALFFFLWQIGTFSGSSSARPETIPGPRHNHQSQHLPCRSLPGANDTVVVLKTGSTELKDKLPIHFSTTLRCYPNYLIFSDHDEYVQGEHVIDALEDVSDQIKENHNDFLLWRRLRDSGREGLAQDELHGAALAADAWTGHTDNPGWKLDKWKFIPMVKRTLQEYPDSKWYIFAEADSYILWASMLQFLKALNADKPHYTGNQMAIGEDLFAHGGSVFAVSRPAMENVVAHYEKYKQTIEEFTDRHWAGDCILGKAIRESGTPFTYAWPVLQTDDPGTVPYTAPDGSLAPDPKKRPWCFPSVSYHHITAEVMEDLWKFEQQWIGSKDPVSANLRSCKGVRNVLTQQQDDTGFFRHKDFFAQYIIPRMLTPKTDWDNKSKGEERTVESFEECRKICESKPECKQYALHKEGVCKTSPAPMLGSQSAEGVRSGWLVDRMWDLHDNMPACTTESWPL